MHKKDDENRQRVLRATAQQAESLGRAGVTHLKKPSAKKPPAKKTPANKTTPSEPHDTSLAAAKGAAPSATTAGDPLEILRCEVEDCTRCEQLATTRTQTVFGTGSPNARLCFLGEAPGAEEDRQGKPFVGRSGQLLTKIIEACTLSRDDVFILNVLKCRPPDNRNPRPDEVKNCRKFLDRQLALIQPEFICCLGAVAAQTLLETNTPIGRMRGKFFDYRGIRTMCTYHPAYLLRNPPAKKDCWEDMQMLMVEMGLSAEG